MHYWVVGGIGQDLGNYTVTVNSTVLGGSGLYTFSLNVMWNQAVAPYYQNISTLYMTGSVRLIQSMVISYEPNPPTVPIFGNVSIMLSFTDLDHSIPIENAESAISLVYKSTGLAPTLWNINGSGNGLYEVTVNCSDAGTLGTNAFIITIDLYPYQPV